MVHESDTPIDTPAFRNWFGQSVVTVGNRIGSEPLIVFHGSRSAGFRSFTKKDRHHVGHFFTDDYKVAASYTSMNERALMPRFRSIKEANAYAEENMIDFEVEIEKDFEYDIDGSPIEDRNTYIVWANSARQGEFESAQEALDYINYELEISHPGIYEVYLRIEEPLIVDAQGADWNEIPYEVDGELEAVTTNWLSQEALGMGADGVIIHNVVDSGGYGGDHPATVYIIFSPTQVKSVENRGTWDPRDEIITNPSSTHDRHFQKTEQERVVKNEIFELEAAGFTETSSLPVLVVPAAPSEIRSNPGLPWHPRSEEEAFQRAYAVGARELELPVERYTDIPKLGLNPVNKYNTPTGLYWYPLGKTEAFAVDRPYRITAELVGMGVDLGSINETSIENLTELLVDIFGYEFTIEEVAQESADFIDKKQYEATFVLEGNKKVKRSTAIYRDEQERLAALWWSITRHAATVVSLERERSLVNSWTSVFRALGIDFVYDPGYEVIHQAEPAQVVSFSNNSKSLQSVNIEQNEKARDVPDFPVFKFLKERGKDFLITADLAKRKYQRQAFSEGSTLVLPTVKGFHIKDVELSETRLKVIQIGERYGRVRSHYLLVYHEESRQLFNIQATQEYWTFFQPSRGRLEQRELGKDRDLADYANIPSNVVLERLSLARLGGNRIPPDEGYNFMARDCTIDNLIIDRAIEPLGTPANNIFTRCTITNVLSRYKSDFIDYSFVSCFFDNTDFSKSNLSAFSLEDCSFEECIYDDYTIWPDGFDPKEHVGLSSM